MKTSVQVLFLACLLLQGGCLSERPAEIMLSSLLDRDVTRSPGQATDFVPGQVYELEHPVFLEKYDREDKREIPALARLGYGGTSSDLEEFKRKNLGWRMVQGLVMPGERVRVTRFMLNRVPRLGTFFDVFGVIDSGEYQGTEVQLNFLTKEGNLAGSAHVNPEYLAPVQ